MPVFVTLTQLCMYQKIRNSLYMTAWILGPSVLWSFVFRQVFFCVDPLLIHPVDKLLPRWLGMMLRGLWILGFAGALLFAWNIPPQSYAFYLREALPFSPLSVWLSLGTVLSFLAWFLWYRTGGRELGPIAWSLPFAGVVLLVLKSMCTLGVLQLGWVQDYVRSPVLGFGRMVAEMRRDEDTPVGEAYGATFHSFVHAQPELPPKVILMVVESWAETEASLQQMVGAMRSERLHVIGSGLTTYRGSTLSGEFRELCAKDLMPTADTERRSSSMECVPTFLQRKGYQVTGVHGYKRFFYARGTFWARFGIPQAEFVEELARLPQCPGPFEGVCDADLIRRGVDLLDQDGKRFVYLLTLSSHEPVPSSALRVSGVFFRNIEVAHSTQVVTRRAISDLLLAIERRPDQPCTLAYVAGDHQPPSATGRQGLFQKYKVPFLAFTYNCPTSMTRDVPATPAVR